MNYSFITLTFFLFGLYSCSNPTFKALYPVEQNGITVESNSWRGTFDPAGGFGLKVINNGVDRKNCEMIFDDKYSHTFSGLQNEGKGMFKDSVFRNGDTLTLTFIHDEVSSMLYFKIDEKNYRPKTLRIRCSDCNSVWEF